MEMLFENTAEMMNQTGRYASSVSTLYRPMHFSANLWADLGRYKGLTDGTSRERGIFSSLNSICVVSCHRNLSLTSRALNVLRDI